MLSIENIYLHLKLTLVVQQLFSGLGGILGVGRFNNGVNGARFLAETAVDALGHVDIVAGSATRSVSTLFGFNCDGLGRADLLWHAPVSTHVIPVNALLIVGY